MKKTPVNKEKKIRSESLKILAKRDVSSFKLEQKLLEKGFSKEEVLNEIEELKNKNLINDEKILQRMKEVYLEKGKGFFYIKYHLNNEGIEIPEIDLNEEVASVIKAIKSKKILKSDLKDQKKKIKLLLFLSRRGFRHEAISRGIEKVLGK